MSIYALPMVCPSCGGTDLEGDRLESKETNIVTQEMYCFGCKLDFDAVFNLAELRTRSMSNTSDSPSQERSRTLVRVVEVSEKETWARVCKVVVPGWNVSESVVLHRDQVPPDIWDLFEVDKRFHAKVNVGADEDCPEDLVFSDWERK